MRVVCELFAPCFYHKTAQAKDGRPDKKVVDSKIAEMRSILGTLRCLLRAPHTWSSATPASTPHTGPIEENLLLHFLEAASFNIATAMNRFMDSPSMSACPASAPAPTQPRPLFGAPQAKRAKREAATKRVPRRDDQVVLVDLSDCQDFQPDRPRSKAPAPAPAARVHRLEPAPPRPSVPLQKSTIKKDPSDTDAKMVCLLPLP